ncbi:MAG: diguanylate cyclase [Thermoanaerobacterales bacterium]|nr:diguanylate cyclase [Bacillota bacterium]MDI6906636.1 diguanylate cyclase [Thermoanaerobacterales bacterium]
MRRKVEEGLRLGSVAVLAGAVALSALVLYEMKQVKDVLGGFPEQIDKVVASDELHYGLLAQAYFMRGYMLYKDPICLDEFHRQAELNRVRIEQLLRSVRDSRRPLTEQMLAAHEEYTQACREEIIPLVQRGDTAAAVRAAESSRVQDLAEKMLASEEALRGQRLKDTYSLVGLAGLEASRALYWGIGAVLFIILAGLTGGSLVAHRMALEYMVYRLVLLNSHSAVMVIRRDGRIHSVNRVAESIFTIRREEVVGRRFSGVFSGRAQPGEVAFSYPVEDVISSGDDACNIERDYEDSEGRRHTLLVDCQALRSEGGSIHGAALIVRDITERKLVEESLRGLSIRDGMTALYNHTYLRESLVRKVAEAEAGGGRLAFLMLDVDNFKSYNDCFGHPAGDELLQTLARILERNARVSDIVARYGGDEFAIILSDADEAAAVELGERIRRAVREYHFPHREALPDGRVTVSVGVACYPGDADDADGLVRLADEALYTAKRNAKNRVEVYFSAFKELQADWPQEQGLLYNVGGLLAMVNSKDRYTYGHSEKVAYWASRLARAAGLTAEEVRMVRLAAFLHDIGKVSIPERVLNKPGVLNERERRLIRDHPVTGAAIIRHLKPLQDIIPAILHHHERYDGTGYPDGLAGERIPLPARIIALADSWDAITSERPYQRARSAGEAVAEIKRCTGTQFDPELASLFINEVLAREPATRVDDGMPVGKEALITA